MSVGQDVTLNGGEAQQQGDFDPYSLFIFSMKSHVTREKYTGRFRKFLESIGFADGTIEECCKNPSSSNIFSGICEQCLDVQLEYHKPQLHTYLSLRENL